MEPQSILAIVHDTRPYSYVATREIQASFNEYMDLGEEFYEYYECKDAEEIVEESHEWLRPMCHSDGPLIENLAAVADKAFKAFPKPVCFVWAPDIGAMAVITGEPDEVLLTIGHHKALLEGKIKAYDLKVGRRDEDNIQR